MSMSTDDEAILAPTKQAWCNRPSRVKNRRTVAVVPGFPGTSSAAKAEALAGRPPPGPILCGLGREMAGKLSVRVDLPDLISSRAVRRLAVFWGKVPSR